MSKMNKLIARILTTLLIAGIFGMSQQVYAGFGVSPAEVIKDHLKPGAHFEQQLTLSRSEADEDLKVIIEPDLEEMSSWFKFEPSQELVFAKGIQRLPVKVVVDVPAEAELKTYDGRIRIKATTVDEEASGVSIVKGARVDVSLVTTQLDVRDLKIDQIKMADVFRGEKIRLALQVTNKGNIAAAPTKVSFTVLNLLQEPLQELETSDLAQVPPNETLEIYAEFEATLDKGEYFGEAEVYLGDEVIRKERLVFRVMEDLRSKDASIITQQQSLVANIKDFFEAYSRWLVYIAIINGPISLIAILVMARTKTSNKARNAVIFLLSISVIASLITLFAAATQNRSEKIIDSTEQGVENMEMENLTQDDNSVAEPTDSTNSVLVKGARSTYQASPEPLVVRNNEKPNGYMIYAEPSTQAEVIYLADEDESFSVFDQNESWYHIILDDGSKGWLRKADVKNASPD